MNIPLFNITEVFNSLLNGEKICHNSWPPGKYIRLYRNKLVDRNNETINIFFSGIESGWYIYKGD